MPDGTELPYREWLPANTPDTIVLALHGMNDSRDAWEYPGPDFASAGMALFAPDLRGFGATRSRGLWPGTDGFTSDIRVMVRLLRHRYPHTRLILMAESMGAAALMVLATQPHPPPVDGYVLIAPAVWGRAEMNVLMRAALWLADHTVPGLTVTGRGIVKVTASDNRQALIRLSHDPLTIHETRIDAIAGLVDLMSQALAAASSFHAPALFLTAAMTNWSLPGRPRRHGGRCPPGRPGHSTRTAITCCCVTRTAPNLSTTSWPGSDTPTRRCRPARTLPQKPGWIGRLRNSRRLHHLGPRAKQSHASGLADALF